MKLKGIVLAGGKSSRFGEDKALARWEGATLLGRAVDLLSALDLDPEVIVSPDKKYSFLTCPTHHDIVPEKGPLGGLYTAFSIFPESALLVLTCDMPLLTQNILQELVRVYHESACPVVFGSSQIQQPFPGIYLSAFKPLVQECLDSNQPSLKHFLSLIPNLNFLPEPENKKIFLNVNTQEELKAAEI